MIKRWHQFNNRQRNIKPLYEIFNIEKEEANSMFTDESPLFQWQRHQEDNSYQKDENLLNIPYKNVILENKSEFNLFLFDADKPIVYANFKKFRDGLQSKLIVKSKSSNIPNLGPLVYEAISKDLKLPIYSDIQQTLASKEKIWAKLFQKYPARIVAYNIRTEKQSKITNQSSQFNPMVDNNPIYVNKAETKVNSHGENHPDNQLVDWPTGIDPLSPIFIEDMFLEKDLYLIKFLPV